MTDMICPKHKDCPYAPCEYKKSHPENRSGTYFSSNNYCPDRCIPYISELKKGDSARVLGKTEKCTEDVRNCDYLQTLESTKKKVGDVVEIAQKQTVCKYCGQQIYSIVGSCGYWHEQDLELIEEADMTKYKYTKIPTIENLYESADGQCFYDHLADLMKHFHPQGIKKMLDFDRLIAWAEKIPARIKWLLDEDYIIEEVQSEYDKWVDECPAAKAVTTTGEWIEWAKRMPKEAK